MYHYVTHMLLLISILTQAAMLMTTGVKSRANFQLQEEHVIPENALTLPLRVMSAESCAYLCAKNPSCSAFYYSEGIRTCIISYSCFGDTAWWLSSLRNHDSLQQTYIDAEVCSQTDNPLKVYIDEWQYNRKNTDDVNLGFYSKIPNIFNLETCLKECRFQLEICRGVHYFPTNKMCRLLNYNTVYYLGLQPGVGTQLFYTLTVDTMLARDKPATISSVYYWNDILGNREAHYGNDGGYIGDQSLVHTEEEVSPYWSVDLESTCEVIALVFFNRMEHIELAKRAINPSVRTSLTTNAAMDADFELCDHVSGTIPAQSTLFSCEPPRLARSVSFHLYNNQKTILNFQEIEIHGICY